MYNILGIMKGLNDNAKSEQLNESVKQPTVYETVEPKGSIMEAVKSLESKYAEFKEGIEDKIEAAREKAAAKGMLLEGLNELRGVPGGGDDRLPLSRIVQVVDKLLKAGNKVDCLVGGARGHVTDADLSQDGFTPNGSLHLKKYNKPYARGAGMIRPFLAKDDDNYEILMIGPKHYKIVDKAVKDKKAVEEGAGPYTLDDPKHPKFKANYDKYKAKHPDCTLAEFVAAMKKREAKMNEAAYDEPAAPDADAIAKRKRLQAIKDRQEDERVAGGKDATNTPIRKVAGKAYGGAAQKDDGIDADTDYKPTMADRKGKAWHQDIPEVAPPGAKAERMVKHIKKGYAKDGKLTKKEKGIAYATAWKAHNKGQVEEGVEFGDTVKNSSTKFKKAKVVKEARDMTKSQYFDEQVALALASEQPGLDTSSPKFNEAVYNEIIAQGMTAKAARNIMLLDEDFLGDVATAYGYFCKHNDEVAAHAQGSMQEPVDAVQEPVDAMQELDEIAKLAGLTNEMDSKVPADSNSPLTHTDACPVCETAPCSCEHDVDEGNAFTGKLAATPKGGEFKLGDKAYKDTSNLEEEEMEEGNEFSGALAKAKAAGEKEFEVDGKRYTVKEDITLTADGEDVINLFRKLSGLDPVASPVDVAQPAQPDAGVQVVPDIQDVIAGQEEVAEDESDPKQRDIEYVNTPREEQAGAEAAFPGGTDLNRPKRMYKRASPGDNPMAVKEAALWEKYESMISDIKK